NGGRLELNGGIYRVVGNGNSNADEVTNGLFALGGNDGVNDGVIEASGLTIFAEGTGGRGVAAGATVGSSRTSGQISLADSTVMATGMDGLAAETAFGSALTSENSVLASTRGAGILLRDNAMLSLEQPQIITERETFVTEFSAADQLQQITVGEGSVAVENNG